MSTIINPPVWDRISLGQLSILLSEVNASWWVAGGLAIDLFLGRETRKHEDLDIVIDRADQMKFYSACQGWDLQQTDPPGSLKPIDNSEASLNANAVWCRENAQSPWRFEFLLSPFDKSEWIYRRNSKIRGPIETFGWKNSEGVRILAPEIQLLYKSKARRPKDELDFENCLTVLSKKQRLWLRNSLVVEHGPDHPWIQQLILTSS